MSTELRIRKWGNAHGILINRKAMKTMKASEGDRYRIAAVTGDKVVLERINTPPKQLMAAGILRQYADENLRKKEKEALGRAMKEKYGNAH
jgi:antitoxin component of MazEF toxin-antitoxin module